MSGSADALHSLTPRERDCLRLLRQGLFTPQVASALGISVATLNKHLASARRKLGVIRTAHALLLCPRDALSTGSASWDAISAVLDSSPPVCDFARALESCPTFYEAWATLRDHVSGLGVTYLSTVLVAEPPGQLTNGARGLATSAPKHLFEMHQDMGGANADPAVRRIATEMTSVLVDNERLVYALLDDVPKPVAALGRALLDEVDMRFCLHQVDRDSFTGAPLTNGFFVDTHAVADFRRNSGGDPKEALQAISRVFWDFVQDKRLLRPIAGLTHRQVEVLTLLARGFSLEESAEQMSVSRRSVERTLAGARKKLGARTTPAAIYRAMVYRALA
ncbi:MAG: response regulator transcription factor [Methyloceanibacter sp.]|uniref:response regulator transcription factor n=1 Tax=Methyloceanibacter sp. TaxID=1965321 RepID=UPI003D6D02F4